MRNAGGAAREGLSLGVARAHVEGQGEKRHSRQRGRALGQLYVGVFESVDAGHVAEPQGMEES